MKKAKRNGTVDELRAEYDPALIRAGVRGKYAERYHRSQRTVTLAPDVAAAFPDAEAVNDALRLLVRIAKRSVPAVES